MPLLLATALLAGCGSDAGDDDDGALSRTQVEQRVAKMSPSGRKATARCVERDEERVYRCELQTGSVTSYYTVFVSKDGKVVQLKEE